MPPHCDTMDGPVARAAMRALATGEVDHALPWVYAEGEAELRDAFERAIRARAAGGEAAAVADQWFYETIVRVHRRGEGASFEGVRPAGLDHGPVLPHAERAIETGDLTRVELLLIDALRHGLHSRLQAVLDTQGADLHDVAAMRRHVNATLDFQLYAHHAYQRLSSGDSHEAPRADAHPEAASHAH